MSRTSHNSLGAFVSLFLASSCWLLLDAPALAAPAYTLIDLGTLGGSTSTGTAINANGYAVGSSTTSGGATHAFEYNPNTHSMTDLGTLAGQTSSVANDINDSNVIVGQSGNAAFRYDTVHGLVSMERRQPEELIVLGLPSDLCRMAVIAAALNGMLVILARHYSRPQIPKLIQ